MATTLAMVVNYHEELPTIEPHFLKLGFTPCKAEQPLQGMELQEKEAQNIKAYRKSFYKEPTVNRCLLILDLKAFSL